MTHRDRRITGQCQIGTAETCLDGAADRVADVESGWPLGCGQCSTLGRPRALTEAQIAYVLQWHDTRQTLKQVAFSLGVSTSTVASVIRSRGKHYKQPPPEKRGRNLKTQRRRRWVLQEAGWL